MARAIESVIEAQGGKGDLAIAKKVASLGLVWEGRTWNET